VSSRGKHAASDTRQAGLFGRLRAGLTRGGSGRRRRTPVLDIVEDSPLRGVDPRAKLAISLCVSLAVMLPLKNLLAAIVLYAGLLAWAKLLPAAGNQLWRLRWLLVILFVVDWWLISPEHAVLITLRICMLTSAFALFFSTTTPGELRLALHWLRVPYRYAFSLSLAFQSMTLMDEEWRTIREAQRVRGAWMPLSGWRNLRAQVADLVSLAVPAIVMTTKRAWAVTEAAYARGFDSPHRRSYGRLVMHLFDWTLLVAAVAVTAILVAWR
jgi:energy-coupling factor transporter transmembrane protein EcfT